MDLLQWSLALSWSHPIRWESLCFWTTLWKMGWMGTCVPENENKTAWGTIVRTISIKATKVQTSHTDVCSSISLLFIFKPCHPCTLPHPPGTTYTSLKWHTLLLYMLWHRLLCFSAATDPCCCVSLLAAWTPVLVIYLSVHLSRLLIPPGSRSSVCSFTSNCNPHRSPATVLFWNT